MYLAAVGVRPVEDITEALWGDPVSDGPVTQLNQMIYAHFRCVAKPGYSGSASECVP